MARSRGQLRKRGENKYLVRVYVGRIDGKRKYKSKIVNGTEDDAEAKLTEMLRKNDRGTLPKPNSEKLESFMDEWLEMKEGKVAPGSLRIYKRVTEIHVKPDLGHLRLEDINSRLIQTWINALETEKELSPSYIRLIHTTLRQAIQQAVIWEMIPFNPAEGGRIHLPRQEDREYRIFTEDEIAKFLDETAGDRFHALWVLLFSTGLRPGEALALKWKDLENGWLRVRRVIRRVSSEGRELGVSDELKTKQSRRRVKLPEYTQEVLQRHKARQAETKLKAGDRYERNGFIFAREDGSFVDPKMARDDFNSALGDCNLPNEIRLYDTRHTHISHLIMKGAGLKKVSARAGHSSISQTADTYAHLSEQAEEEMAEVTAGLFAQAR